MGMVQEKMSCVWHRWSLENEWKIRGGCRLYFLRVNLTRIIKNYSILYCLLGMFDGGKTKRVSFVNLSRVIVNLVVVGRAVNNQHKLQSVQHKRENTQKLAIKYSSALDWTCSSWHNSVSWKITTMSWRCNIFVVLASTFCAVNEHRNIKRKMKFSCCQAMRAQHNKNWRQDDWMFRLLVSGPRELSGNSQQRQNRAKRWRWWKWKCGRETM